jgi:pectate lyase-like protein
MNIRRLLLVAVLLSLSTASYAACPADDTQVNLKACGAVGDGSVDDSAALLSALTAASSPGNPRKIFVPAGVYLIGTSVVKSFANANNIVIEGTGSGSVFELYLGQTTAAAIDLSKAESIEFRDLAFTGGGMDKPFDTGFGITFSAVQNAVIHNCYFYGIVAQLGLIRAYWSGLTITNSTFKGCFSDAGNNNGLVQTYNWRKVFIENCDFIDYGTLNEMYLSKPYVTPYSWIQVEDPAGDLREVINGNTAPQNSGLTAQTPVTIQNCRFDEGALHSVSVRANAGTRNEIGQQITRTERIILRNNNSNSSSGNSVYFIYQAVNVDIEDCYAGYAYLQNTRGLEIWNTNHVTVRRSYFTQKADEINLSDVDSLVLEDSIYSTLTVANHAVKSDIKQEGNHVIKTLPIGTYTYAGLTPLNLFSAEGTPTPTPGPSPSPSATPSPSPSPSPSPVSSPSPSPSPSPTPPPQPILPGTRQNVTWMYATGVTASGNSLQKDMSTPASWTNSGALSAEKITSGDGYVQAVASEVTTYRMFGIDNTGGNSTQYYGEIDFAMYMQAGGSLCVYERAVARGCFGSYATGDWLTVAVQNGRVVYMKNDTVIYTSAGVPQYPLVVDTSLYSPGATINSVVLASAAASPTPTPGPSPSPTHSSESAGLFVQEVTSREPYVQALETQLTAHRMAGADDGNSRQYYGDLDFAMYTEPAVRLGGNEPESAREYLDSDAPPAWLTLAVQNARLVYITNDTAIYGSAAPLKYPALADISLYYPGVIIRRLVIPYKSYPIDG